MEQLTEPRPEHDHLPGIDTRFIPARPGELASAIDRTPGLFGAVAGRAAALLDAIDRVIAQEVSALHEFLDTRYAALNPDEDTPRELLSIGAEDRGERDLLDHLAYVLDKANFDALDEIEVEQALKAGTSYGVKVRIDPSRVTHLTLFVRGRGEVPTPRRVRSRPWRVEDVEVPVYRRLIVVTRLTGETGIRLKLFRDIPVRDVEALMPHAEIQMSIPDRLLVFGGGAGALGGLAPKVFAVITGSVVSLFSLASAALIGFGGLAFRSFLGYRRTKKMRTSMRTQHLYERNLASNAAVMHTILRMIRLEEVKEALLVYALLASEKTPTESDEAIDRHAEAWIKTEFGRVIDFDCPDALETLDRLGLWADRAERRVVDPDEAIQRLTRHWAEQRTEGYHLRPRLKAEAEHRGNTPTAEPRQHHA